MPRKSEDQDLDWIRMGSVVIFTGIFGTGSIFGLKSSLVRDNFTAALFWVDVVAFTIAAVLAITLKARGELKTNGRMRPFVVAMLICFIIGMVSCGTLTTLRAWK